MFVSFILPVLNIQATLQPRVEQILAVLAELTDEFELMIVDRGSDDATRHRALDLVREHPPVDLLEMTPVASLYDAIELGICRTAGEIIFVHDPDQPLAVAALKNLWLMRHDDDLVMAQSRSSDVKPSVFESLSATSPDNFHRSISIRIIRRCALLASRSPATAERTQRVTRTDPADRPGHRTALPKLLTRLNKR